MIAFAPYFLIVWVWNGGNGVGVTAIPMPTLMACQAAERSLPGTVSRTPTRGFCIPGGIPEGAQ